MCPSEPAFKQRSGPQLYLFCCLSQQVCKPAASVDAAEPITELDLYVGAVITIHQRTFELLEADEFTMQARSADLPSSALLTMTRRCGLSCCQSAMYRMSARKHRT